MVSVVGAVDVVVWLAVVEVTADEVDGTLVDDLSRGRHALLHKSSVKNLKFTCIRHEMTQSATVQCLISNAA